MQVPLRNGKRPDDAAAERSGSGEFGVLKAILLVEDNVGDARLLREMMREHGARNTRLTHVTRMRDAESHLAENAVDLVLLDLGLEDVQGVEGVRRIRAAAPLVPLVVLTGLEDGTLARHALKEGAQDYLIKGHIEGRGFIRALQNAVERKALDDALFAEKEQAEVTLGCIADAVISTNLKGEVTFMNKVAETLIGRSWEEVGGQPVADLVRIVTVTTREPLPPPLERAALRLKQKFHRFDCLLLRHDGAEIPIEESIAAIHDRRGEPTGSVIVLRDVSAARTLAVQQAHIAQHDFLTGLTNRMLLVERINSAIAIAPRHKQEGRSPLP